MSPGQQRPTMHHKTTRLIILHKAARVFGRKSSKTHDIKTKFNYHGYFRKLAAFFKFYTCVRLKGQIFRYHLYKVVSEKYVLCGASAE